jgi:hypothetical protein
MISMILLQVLASVVAGVVVGIAVGLILTARAEAISGTGPRPNNPFIFVFSRPLRDLSLIEWLVIVAVVLNVMLVLIAFAVMPLVVSDWLSQPKGLYLFGVYTAGIAAFWIAYPVGRKLWLRRV